MLHIDDSDKDEVNVVQFDLWGNPIQRQDPIDALRRGLFKRNGETSKRIDSLEKRVIELENLLKEALN